MSDQHSDFLAVPEAHRWTKPLNELMGALQKAAWAARGARCWFVLPHGALVSLRVIPPEEGRPAFQYELRIARKTAPTDELGWKRWANELATFLKHFALDELFAESAIGEPGKAEAIYRFVPARPTPAAPKCSRCKTRDAIEPGQWKEDLCVACATELGRQEAEANNRERTP